MDNATLDASNDQEDVDDAVEEQQKPTIGRQVTESEVQEFGRVVLKDKTNMIRKVDEEVG